MVISRLARAAECELWHETVDASVELCLPTSHMVNVTLGSLVGLQVKCLKWCLIFSNPLLILAMLTL